MTDDVLRDIRRMRLIKDVSETDDYERMPIYMQFIIKAYDGPNMLEKRMEVRPQHLEGMARLGKHIVCAGGLTDEQGKLKGSALIVDFDDEAGVKEYLESEPYVVAGVWKDITCEPLNVVLVNGEKYTK